MIFDESLTFNLKISTLNSFFGIKKGNISDLPDFDYFRLPSLLWPHQEAERGVLFLSEIFWQVQF